MTADDHRTYCQAVLDATLDAVVTLDENHLVHTANQATRTVFGYDPSELVGRPFNLLVRERLQQGRGRRALGYRKDGVVFPINLAVSQVCLGGRLMLTAFVRDLTEVITLENELRRREIEYLVREEAMRHEVVQEERKYLSRELHDSVSQALFGIVLGSQAALNALDQPERAREALDYVLALAEGGLAEMRALILQLRPESLESEGLVGSLARQVKALCRRHHLELKLELGEEPPLPLELKQHCYRVATEAMHNVVKHACARCLTLRVVTSPERLTIEVSDDGRGFDASSIPPTAIGIQSMRERIEGIGGRISIESAPGGGARVQAELSLP
ncbi:MAG: PAS domain-containing sensor histidine kinase [Candidatus Eremiobacterota bacterium]